jgi:hypothetical protein
MGFSIEFDFGRAIISAYLSGQLAWNFQAISNPIINLISYHIEKVISSFSSLLFG